MAEPLAYLNGRFVPASQAWLPLHDAGFLQGVTVTDLCRTFRQRLFRLTDHLHRFRQGCTAVRIPLALSDAELTALAEQLVQHNAALQPGQELALVLFATPGPVGLYAGQAWEATGPPTLGLHTFPLQVNRYARLFREGARLRIPSIRQLPAVCVDPRLKQRSRLHWWLANLEVQALEPGAMPLLLDLDGCVTETAVANFLIVRRGVVLSPPRQAILNGVSLQVVQELCAGLGLSLEEQPLRPQDCYDAEEALLTNTSFCVAGVSRIDDQPLPWPGPVLRQLLDAWGRLVGMDLTTHLQGPVG